MSLKRRDAGPRRMTHSRITHQSLVELLRLHDLL